MAQDHLVRWSVGSRTPESLTRGSRRQGIMPLKYPLDIENGGDTIGSVVFGASSLGHHADLSFQKDCETDACTSGHGMKGENG